jgi:hypothetical protein
MKKIFYIVIVTILTTGVANAQLESGSGIYNGYTSVTYSVGFGTGDLGEYISKPSWRGMTIEFGKFVTPEISIGIEASWNTFFEEKGYDTYTKDTYSLSGKQYRYNHQFPILATFNYTLMGDGTLRPFGGLGIGTMYSQRNTDMGQWELREEAWHFALRPEVGILYEVGEGTHLKVSGKYYTGFSAGDLDTQSYFALNVGLVFMR